MRYVLRPRACSQHPGIARSLAPGAEPPQTTQELLAELAGPTGPVQTDDLAPPTVAPGDVIDTLPPASVIPAGPGGTPPVTPEIGAPGTPAGPGGPTAPPTLPGPLPIPGGTPDHPVPGPPTEPVIPPGPDNPPPLLPPVDVPGGPGPVPPMPPIDVGPTTTPAPIPEPGTWELIILGFLGLGVAFRRNRTPRANAKSASPPEGRPRQPRTND
jgi:hypothetical protein